MSVLVSFSFKVALYEGVFVSSLKRSQISHKHHLVCDNFQMAPFPSSVFLSSVSVIIRLEKNHLILKIISGTSSGTWCFVTILKLFLKAHIKYGIVVGDC